MHIGGFFVMLLIQYLSGHWIFNLQNYYTTSRSLQTGQSLSKSFLDWIVILEMLFYAPIREEIVFRGLMTVVIYIRISSALQQISSQLNEKNKQSDDSRYETDAYSQSNDADYAKMYSKLYTSIVSGCLFGLIHLMNLLSVENRISISYSLFQCLMGGLIGCFYTMHTFRQDGVLWECIFAHMINNIASSFIPLNFTIDLSNRVIIYSLIQTTLTYIGLTYCTAMQLRRKCESQNIETFHIIDGNSLVEKNDKAD